MRLLITVFTIGLILLQVAGQKIKNVTEELNSNRTDSIATATIKIKAYDTIIQATQNKIDTNTIGKTGSSPMVPVPTPNEVNDTTNTITTNLISSLSASTPSPLSTPTTATVAATNISFLLNQYCAPSLCEFFNGRHTVVRPHIACKNSGNFGPACGSQPHLLEMSERRRNLILNLHNLARSRIASGQVVGYKSASHMPQLKWDNELEYLATLHVMRCKFEHDLCHNTPRYPYSGQNIGYYWKGANITSHSKRMKNIIVSWYKEHKDADQTFIDSFHLHPKNKMIGHFTAMIGDRVHHVGCAVIRFYESNLTKILMTCNYDYNNFSEESVYKTGPMASNCTYRISEKYIGLCDWKVPAYEL